jgi:hypothetical protein
LLDLLGVTGVTSTDAFNKVLCEVEPVTTMVSSVVLGLAATANAP